MIKGRHLAVVTITALGLHCTGSVIADDIRDDIRHTCSEKLPIDPYSSRGDPVSESTKINLTELNEQLRRRTIDKAIVQNGLWGSTMRILHLYGSMGEYDFLFGHVAADCAKSDDCRGFGCGFAHCQWCTDVDNYYHAIGEERPRCCRPPQITF